MVNIQRNQVIYIRGISKKPITFASFDLNSMRTWLIFSHMTIFKKDVKC